MESVKSLWAMEGYGKSSPPEDGPASWSLRPGWNQHLPFTTAVAGGRRLVSVARVCGSFEWGGD
jgi:hypothetical protein